MSLIKCPECGREISDKSDKCIGCGFPIKEHLENKTANEQNNKLKEKEQEDAYKRFETLKDKRSVIISHDGYTIQICGMNLIVKGPYLPPINDRIWNFSLEYFAVSMGFSIGLMINNVSKNYSTGIRDFTSVGDVKKKLLLFKEIMENNGLYAGRSRFDVLYRKTKEETDMQVATGRAYKYLSMGKDPKKDNFHGIYRYVGKEKIEIFCPRCNSQNCSYYMTETVIPEKTKTRYTANLNPFKPFTLVDKKEKVIRKEKSYTEKKIICNDCGNIFE